MIRPVTPADAGAWQLLRQVLWPEATEEEHATDITRFFWSGNDDAACLVADGPEGIIGFVELSIRPYAEGCVTDRVGYLEGWYVAPAWRRRGVGRALVAASERWAREQGCREFASDTPIDNHASQAAHEALGFLTAERIVCYCKPLVGQVASPAHAPSP